MSKGFDLSDLSGKGIQTFEEEDSEFAGEDITVCHSIRLQKVIIFK